jgi:hypothetical protein
MTEREALRLALEALAQDRAWLESDAPKEVWDKNNDAITACEQALEQQEPEPVLCLIDGVVQPIKISKNFTGHLYTSPPKRDPLTDEQITDAIRTSSLYMKPSPHTPQPIWLAMLVGYARAIEAAHNIGEKK